MSELASIGCRRAAAAVSAPSQRYINRELSWLAFNERVLEEAVIRVIRCSSGAVPVDLRQQPRRILRYASPSKSWRRGVAAKSDDGLAPTAAVGDRRGRHKLVRDNSVAGPICRNACMPNHFHSTTRVVRRRPHLARQLFTDRLLPVLTPIAIGPAHRSSPIAPWHGCRAPRGRIADQCSGARPDRRALYPVAGRESGFIVEEVLRRGIGRAVSRHETVGHGLFRALRQRHRNRRKAQDLAS